MKKHREKPHDFQASGAAKCPPAVPKLDMSIWRSAEVNRPDRRVHRVGTRRRRVYDDALGRCSAQQEAVARRPVDDSEPARVQRRDSRVPTLLRRLACRTIVG